MLIIIDIMRTQISLEWEERGLISLQAILICEMCPDVTIF